MKPSYLLLLPILFLAACATANGPQYTPVKAGKGEAKIVVYRSSFPYAVPVQVNGKLACEVPSNGFFIPNTLDTNWSDKLEDFFRQLSRQPNDDEKIVIAMEKGRSRTRKPGRGQGSYDMQTLIRKSSHGALSIHSYHGRYIYLNDGTWKCEVLETPLKGTLISWTVRLENEKEQI